MAEAQQVTAEITNPIIVDLGNQRPKRIKALKRGQGKLMNEVMDVLDEVSVNLGDEAEGKVLVPVVLVYQRKQGRRRNRGLLFPF